MKEKVKKDYYEPRYISQTNNSFANSWFNEGKVNNILKEVIFDKDKIVLLGNPGIGKSKELERLFTDLWEEKDKNGLIPFSISLKNFRKSNKFEDLIVYAEWKSLSSIIFILDGLDEIAEIQDFISAFEVFISQNKLSNIKYVISCRTNIYEKYLVNIPNFNTFFLDDLVNEQSRNLLKNKYGIDIDKYELAEKHQNYLKTPFFLDLFASYILEKETLPRTDSEMWELFVKKTLDIHTQKQIKKKLVDRPKLIIDLKKVSFVNELMQKNFSSQEELLSILKGNHLDFIENPFFVELDKDSNKWNFEHRQIQEYFVAKTLSEKTVIEILSIIRIPNINIEVIHPSLFNTISFLINILEKDSTTFIELINWIQSNQIELLFKADSNRIDIFKVKVFQYYFKTECIDKGFWINTNKTFSVLEIAQFGDCLENLGYLLDIIKETKDQPRVVISALNLLNFFTIPFNRKNEVKELFIEILKDIFIQNSIKSKIINCITAHKFCEEDGEYLNLIFEIFKAETNKEINSALLFLVMSQNNIDSLFWYLKEEFLRVNNIVKRDELDEVHRGNSWVLEELILKIVDSNYFIKLISYYFIDEFNINLDNTYSMKILERCLFFSSKENDFIIRFLTSINGKTNYYLQDRLLIDIIVKDNNQFAAFEYLLVNNDFSKLRMLLASIATTGTIELVKERFVQHLINSEEIEIFRNNLWHYNKVISYEFDLLMKSIDFKFQTPLSSEEQLSNQQIQNNLKFQNNFDILFKKDELLREIEIIFQKNNSVIDQNEIRKIESDWYEKNGYWSNTIDTSLTLLHTLVYRYKGNLTFQDVQVLLENDFIRYNNIKTLIKGNVKSNIRFKVSDAQKVNIIDWCIKASSEINFEGIIKLYNNNSFNYGQDYEMLKTIMVFLEEYEFELPQEFLLDCLECFEVDKFKEEDDIYSKLKSRTNDEKLFNKRIIDNILKKKMFSSVMDRHVSYALSHNLKLTFPEIRNYFVDNYPGYNLDEKLEKYIELTGDIELLKQCCEDVESPKCWSAIKILLKLGKEVNFCITKAIEYLDTNLEDSNKFYLRDALGVLFQQNRKEAIGYYYSLLKEDRMSQINSSNYSVVDYVTLEKLFFKTYGKGSDRSVFNDSGAFLSSYVSNLSKDDESYDKTQEVLYDIKGKLNKEEHDTELFYINILIDNSKTSYINSKSKPMDFVDALRKVEEIVN
nr:NACHT domain-containing protein [uncultured Flavobacterium sp.]